MLLKPKSQAAPMPVKRIDHLGQMLSQILPSHGSRVGLRFDDGSDYRALGFDVLRDDVARLVALFASFDWQRQLVVATLTRNRPERDAVDHACLYRGHVQMPLDPKMNQAELEHLIELGQPDLLLVSRAELARTRALLAKRDAATLLLVADAYPCWEDQGVEDVAIGDGEISLAEWFEQPVPELLPPPSGRLDDPDAILAHYATSGTTSMPKLVKISNTNVPAALRVGLDLLNLRPREEVLNIGPRSHIAILIEWLVTSARGYPVTYLTREPEDDGVVEAELAKLKRQGVRIAGVMAPPKFWIFIYKEFIEELKKKPMMRSLAVQLEAIEKHDRLDGLGALDRAKLVAAGKQLRDKLGGWIRLGISSSAKLDGALVTIFGKLGITLLDIYGATEASGIISHNRLDDLRPGTCGRLIDALDYHVVEPRRVPGIDDPVGRLLIKGPMVTPGYVGQAPGSHLDDDGWFDTGDLARVDNDRVVHLVGREKELLTWGDGRLVDPMQLSNLLVRSIHVKDALVTRLQADDDSLSVFVYPDWARIKADPAWRNERDTGLTEAQSLRRRFEQAIAFAQSITGPVPRLSTERIYLLPRPLQRTPTHKIKLLFELQRLDTDNYV